MPEEQLLTQDWEWGPHEDRSALFLIASMLVDCHPLGTLGTHYHVAKRLRQMSGNPWVGGLS